MLKSLYFQRILLFKILIILFLYSICRLLFLLFNPSFFQFGFSQLSHAFYVGLLFDFSAIVYTNSLLILLHVIPIKGRANVYYQAFLNWLFIVVNSIAFLLNLIDTAYFKFSGKRSGLELLKMKSELAGVWKNYIFDFWYLFVLLLLFIVALVKLSKYLKINKLINEPKFSLTKFIIEFLALIPISAICFLGARGGLNLTPINTFDAARLSKAELVPLIVNTPFQFLMSTQQIGLTEKKYFDTNTVNKIYSPIHQLNFTDSVVYKTKPNVVVLIIESLGKEYVGYFNKKGYTPFIDSLMEHSLVFTHAYANGKRSIEGIPAVLASLPTWMDNDYMSSYYQSNHLKSLGAYLQDFGYQTSFYHGGKNGTMSFDNFTAITNGGKYFGMNEYPVKADFDQHWGIFDEPYFQYFAQQLNQNTTPFFASLFTLSSHHPYSIPSHLNQQFSEGTLPIHRTIKYTDYALRKFFETAQKQPWYNNTIFIITADHSAENETPYYQTNQGKYEIPLFVFSNNSNLVKANKDNRTVQQIDILPMVLNYVKYKKPFYSFGENASHNGWAMQLSGGVYQYITWPFVYQFDGSKAVAFYDLFQDSLMQTNKLTDKAYFTQVSKMDSAVKCIIQRYNYDLINNKTHIDERQN